MRFLGFINSFRVGSRAGQTEDRKDFSAWLRLCQGIGTGITSIKRKEIPCAIFSVNSIVKQAHSIKCGSTLINLIQQAKDYPSRTLKESFEVSIDRNIGAQLSEVLEEA